MNHAEIAALLARCAVYDQRTVGRADVEGWHDVAIAQGWTAAAAHRVVVEHYSHGADRPRITPAAVTDAIRVARRAAVESFVVPDAPPRLSAADYPGWYRARRAEHVDRMLERWAGGETIPQPTAIDHVDRPRALPTGAAPSHLRAELERGMARIGRVPRERPRPRRLPRVPATDPGRRAAARAELDRREPVPAPDEAP